MSAAIRRLGRPPKSSSEATRLRILDAARREFALNGFEGTTNRSLADAAGLTTGAIYHYFASKHDLYNAVYVAVQERVYQRFEAALDALDANSTSPPTFSAAVDAILDVVVEMNIEDDSLARFLLTARSEASRDRIPEPANAVGHRRRFFTDLVDEGIARGEIAPHDRDTVLDVITAMMSGLVSISSNSTTHRRAVEGYKLLLAGALINPPS